MPSYSTRRTTLQALGAICCTSLVSGCISGRDSDPGPGDLVIENRRPSSQTTAVKTEKISTDPDDDYGPEREITPTASPLTEREEEFDLGPDEEILKGEYITEVGTFFVRATLPTGESAHGWIGLVKAAGGGVTGEYVDIKIYDDDRSLSVYGQPSGA